MKIFGLDFVLNLIRPLGKNDPIIPFQFEGLRLGKRPARHDPRTLRFANYITADLPTPPAALDNGDKVKQWGMLANDQLGDCTAAGILHGIMLVRSQNGFQVYYKDQDAIDLYSQTCGYLPGDAKTDQGGVEIDILKQWRKNPIQGCDLVAFASVDPTNWEHVKLALYLAGWLYMGVNLPLSAQKPGVWKDTNDTPGSWGGHCMVASGYREKRGLCRFFSSKILTAITWGTTQDMTADWVETYCDELWIPITSAWFSKAGKTPNSFDLDSLLSDVKAVSQIPIN